MIFEPDFHNGTLTGPSGIYGFLQGRGSKGQGCDSLEKLEEVLGED